MSLVVILIILALVLGGAGLLVKGLTWLLIIAGVLFVAGLLAGWTKRGSRRA